jgi:hypothetical protein
MVEEHGQVLLLGYYQWFEVQVVKSGQALLRDKYEDLEENGKVIFAPNRQVA